MKSNIGTLLKVQLLEVLDLNKAAKTRDPKLRRKLRILLVSMVVLYIYMFMMMGIYAYSLIKGLNAIGAANILLVLMMVVSSIATVFASLYKTNGTLFNFADYDEIMSLPIPVYDIVISRVILTLLTDIAFTLCVMIPTGVVYAYTTSPPPQFYLLFCITLLVMPLFPYVIGAILGLVASVVASKFKRSGLATAIVGFFIILGLMALSFNFKSADNVGQIGQMLGDSITRYYPLGKLYLDALTNYSIGALASFLAVSIGIFVVFVGIIARYYKSINALISTTRTSKHYVFKKQQGSSQLKALLKNEVQRYFSSSLYVFNTAFGMVFLAISSVAIFFLDPKTIASIIDAPQAAVIIQSLPALAISLTVGLSCTSACAISIEGRSLWILKSSPVSAVQIFVSKIATNLLVLVPVILIASTCFTIAFHLSGLIALFTYLTPLLCAGLISVAGLCINLAFPSFDWTSEVQVIKQSAAVGLAVAFGLAITAAPIALAILLSIEPLTLVLATTITYAIMLALSVYLLETWGVRRWYQLQ